MSWVKRAQLGSLKQARYENRAVYKQVWMSLLAKSHSTSMLSKILLLTILVSSALATVIPKAQNESNGPDNQLVFCHFMISITSNRKNASDYDDDMKRAKALGIDAFALNIGVDSYTDTQLKRDDKAGMADTSLKDIVDTCICGIYNFNAYVGMAPPEKGIDRLQPGGLAMLTRADGTLSHQYTGRTSPCDLTA